MAIHGRSDQLEYFLLPMINVSVMAASLLQPNCGVGRTAANEFYE
jgi:hypothetical protein